MRDPLTLVDLLKRRAEVGAGRGYRFLVDGELDAPSQMTYEELDRRARALAECLREAGGAGERILLLFPPGLDFIAAFFGCLYAGGVAVPAYPPRPRRADPRLSALAADCRPRIVLTTAQIVSRAAALSEAVPALAAARWIAVEEAERETPGAARISPPSPSAPAFLQYTSGSTGTPKGVVVTHANLVHNQAMICRAFGQSESSVVVGWLPLYHDMGLIGNVLQPLWVGGECVLMPPVAFLQKPLRWLAAIHHYRATTSGGPNFAYDLCVRKIAPEQREALDLSSWSVAYNGAEPVRGETLERFAAAFAPAGFRREAFYPCYGLAEATLFVAGGTAGRGARPAAFAAPELERHTAVPAAGEGLRVLVGCGAAWEGQRIAIADPETGAELPEGRVGEIWVAGPSVAAGYWGRPEESGELFRASLADGAGPFLRTGDLGFFHGGELFVAGRLKDLIILRGRNHYPQDVERTAEAASPALRAGCGAAFAVEVGPEERLVVVYEVDRHTGAEAVLEAVRQAVAEEHEVQVHEVVLVRTGTVPKTSSGKIRRQACAAAWRDGTLEVVARVGAGALGTLAADPALTAATAPDRAALLPLQVEDRGALLLPWLRGEVAQLVHVAPERVDAQRPLTALGLDSLAAVELQHAAESALGVAISLQDLLAGTTLADLAGALAERVDAAAPRRWAPPAGFCAEEHPLSHGQRGLWFLHRLAPAGGAYNLAAVARTADLDPEALRRALEALCGRHPALRSVFAEREGEAVQRVLEQAELDFAVVDASSWEEEAWRKHLTAEAWCPFELTRRPPVRIRVWKRPAGAWVVLLAVHHLVADFWSLALLLEELGVLAAGAPGRLPAPAAAYGEYVHWQRERLAGAEGGRLWEYWRERLGCGLPVLDLPTDRPRPPVQTFRGASRSVFLPPGLAGGLARLGRERGATQFMVLAAAFHALLHRSSGQARVLVGSPTAGREVPELSGVVGYFTNPVVLRADFPPEDLSFASLLEAVRRDALGAFAHAGFPFPLLTERLQPERDASRNPLFQAMLVLQKAHRAGVEGLAAFTLGENGEAVRLGPWTLVPIALPERRSPFDLMLMLAAVEGGLAASLQFATDLFDTTTAARLLGHFERLLQGAVADPARWVGEIELLTPAERQQVLCEWNDTDRDLPRERTLVDLVAEQAARTPEAPALVDGEESLTYRELVERANGLARHLLKLGVGPEVRVGVCLERHFDLPVSLLAVLAAGGAYVPLDPAYPAERLRFMLDDAAAPVVLTRPGLLEGVKAGALQVDPRHLHPLGTGAPAPGGSGRLAYLIYTSGSTGRPKAVAIEHRSAVALVDWAREELSREDLACVLFSTSVCFDLSVFELFVTWSVGGTVVLAPDALALPELPAAERVTLINTVPSALEQLVGGPLPAALRVVNLAGEPLSGDLVRRIHARRPDVRVYNLYGPSEDTTYSTGALIPPGERTPSIGWPVAGTRAFLLDRRGAPVPVGAPGELWLGGAGLARGYLGRPALTAERFVPDALSGGSGERLYRTGDLVRRRAGGELEFLGRIDHQVKIHGFRIELGEIETALRTHPAVRECVVAAPGGRSSGRRLVAYVAGALPPAGATGELQRFLRERLPASLVPPVVVVLESLPRTPNGKVDRRALPEPGGERPELAGAWTAPRDAAEETLAGIWAGVLGIERVGVHDNFFELGGDSILSLQVVARAREAGLRVSAQQLFQHQTVAALAAVAEVAGGGEAAAQAAGPAPLTPIQRWFFSLAPEEPWHFNQAVRVRARGELDPQRLEGALEALLQHHDALRLRFAQDTAGAWRQEVVPWSPSSPLAVVDLGALPSALREEARAAAEAALQTGFDLARGPLLRGLLALADGPPYLLLTAHHLVVDGVSWRILLEDLHMAYAGLRRGAAQRLPARTTSFRDWAERLDRLGAGAAVDPAPAEETGRAGATRRVTAVLRELPRSLGANLRDALLAAVVEAFGRRTGERMLRIDLEVHGRDSSAPGVDLSRTVGWLTALSTVVLDLDGARSPGEAMRRVREQLAAAGRGPGQDRSGARVVFNYLGRFDGALAAESPFAAAEIADVPLLGPRNRRGHAVVIDAWVQNGALTIRWEHADGPGGDAVVRDLSSACLDALREMAAAGSAAEDALAADPGLEDVYAVTPLQAGILLHSLASPGTGAYVQQLSCALEGDFAEAAFVDAWQWLVDRHTILRTRFLGRGLDEPLQAVETAARLPVAWDDWSAWPPEERQGRLAAWLEADRARGFDLDRAPLLRLLLAPTGPRAWHFVLTYHHLLLDGWALVLLLEELFAVYAVLRRGAVPRTPAPAPFREFIDWLRRQDPAPAESAWRQAVSGFSAPTPLAADRPVPPPGAPPRHGEERLGLSAAATGALAAAARRHQLTQGTLVQAAWGVLLGRLSGEEDLVFGAVTSGRSADLPGMEHRVGLFINTLPMRLAVCLEAPLLPWLREVQARAAEVLRHEHTPLAEIQAWSGVARGRRLFDSILAFENYPLDEALARRAGGLAVSGVRFVERIDYPLAVVVAPGERLALQMIYDRRLFAPVTVARRLEHLRRLLEGLAAVLSGPGALADARLADLPWLSAAERHQILHEWNDTRGPVPSGGRLIHQLFEARAAAQGEAVAVVGPGETLTYAELDRRAGRLARHLRELGVGRGSLVAVHLGRSVEMVVAVLAVLKAGGAYVPVEVALPPARVRWIAGFLGLRWAVTETGLRDGLEEALNGLVPRPCLVTVDREEAEVPGASLLPLAPLAGPDDPAYIIFTSGSTGTPKGVVVAHRPVINLIEWVNGAFDVGPADRVLFITALSFDLSVYDVFGLLAAGGSIHVAAERDLREPARLVRLLVEEPVTFWDSAPAALQQLVPFLPAEPAEGARLRLAFLSGDWIPLGIKDEVTAAFPRLRCVGLGGATEATIWSNFHRIETVEREWRSIPYGRPICNARYHVLDAALEPVAVGVAGDLYIGGPVLARGYAGEPVLTAEKFVPDPFAAEPGALLYRTGDRARHFADGRLEFLGRLDHQVKIRGYRIELGEIEAVLADHPGVREALVLVREDVPGDRRLVAWVVPGAAPAPDPGELRAWLAGRLPAYMVPAAFAVLDAWPVTANGKVDRKALPAPESMGAAAGRPPEQREATPVEELVASQWAEVLHLPVARAVRLDESFFELGGHSLLATRLLARLREVLGVELPLRTFFDHPTVAGQAAEIERVLRAGECGELPPLEPVPRGGSLVLSFGQLRLWFLHQLEPASPAYNVRGALRLSGRLRAEVLERSLEELVRRHEMLRTSFPSVAGEAMQRIAPPPPFLLPVVDLSALPAAEEEAAHLAGTEGRRPFDLASGPLLRALLVRRAAEEHLLFLNLHHIIADGWSMNVLVDEAAALYAAFAESRPSPLPEPAFQYADYAAWQRGRLDGEILDRQLEWWRRELADAPAGLDLPTDRPRPAVRSGRGDTLLFALPADLAEAVRALARRHGTTLFMAHLAAFDALLARWSGQEDVVVGTPVANRSRVETEGMVGFLVNTLALRVQTSEDLPFTGLLTRVREATLGAFSHQELPFERLVDALQPERDPSRTPLFQVCFSLDTAMPAAREVAGLHLEPVEIHGGAAKFDLTLALADSGAGGLTGHVEYTTDLFERTAAERLRQHYATLLRGAVEAPGSELRDLPLMSAAERRELIAAGAARRVFASGEPLHRGFERQARLQPEAVAVVDGEERWSYAQVNQRANRLARRLRSLGVGPESRVGLCAERSAELVVGILGILKAGGAYVPADPGSPPDRIGWILTDAWADVAAPVLVAQRQVLPALPPSAAAVARVVCLEDDPAGVSSEDLPGGPDADSLAYVIYTSGSTGRPKGVEVTHRNVARLLKATEPWFDFGAGDAWTLFHSYAFDFSVWEIWGALLYGGRLVVVPYLVSRSPEAFYELLVAERVTVLSQTPSAFRQLAAVAEERPSGALALRFVVFGGEALELASLRGWLERHGEDRPQLINMYGITETTVHVTFRRVRWSDLEAGGSRIGVAIPDLALYLLDRRQDPLPVGVPGEICVGGAGLSRGYLRRQELTAARFIPDAFSGVPGGRLYRSGDLARLRPDGEVEYLGRIDHQVKVRGFRIELGEIEGELAAHPEVREAVVLAREDTPGDRRLVAYVVLAAGAAPEPRELRSHLQARLPHYMVPAAWVFLNSMPVTSNGKLDRKALPAPDGSRQASDYVEPRTPTERHLAAIWAEVLGVAMVGAGDSFFELGGHSLLATRVMSRLRVRCNADLPLRALFETPTLAALAARVEAAQGGAGVFAPLAPIPAVLPGAPLPLSPAQRRLWILDRQEPGDPTYNMSLPVRLGGRLDAALLSRALSAVVARHEVLRTRITEGVEGPVQEILPVPGAVLLPQIDLSALPAVRREGVAAGLAAAEGAVPFDLARGPLARFTLVRLTAEDHLLLATLHHLAGDGWSMGVLVREVAWLLAGGGTAELAAPPCRYADWAAWQLHREGAEPDAGLDWWRQRLAGAPGLQLPVDRDRRAAGVRPGGLLCLDLADATVGALRRRSAAAGATLAMTLLAGYAALLARLSGQDDLVLGLPLANRERPEVEGVIGLFVNTLPLRCDLSGDPAAAALLERVRDEVLALQARQETPFARIVEELRPDRRAGETPFFRTVATLERSPLAGLAVPGLTLAPWPVHNGTAKFDLTLTFVETGRSLTAWLEYGADRIDRTRAERLLGHLVTLLAAVGEGPECPLSHLPLLTAAERHQAAVEWNDTATAYTDGLCVHQLFAAQAAATPDDPAAVCGEAGFTYRELDVLSTRLARRLAARGVRRGSLVGILAERSLDLLAGLLAILKAGGAYVPLDPSYPAEHLETLAADADLALVLAQPKLAAAAPGDRPVVFLETADGAAEEAEEAEEETTAAPDGGAGPDDLVYVLYTSGSTGRPKGVPIPHRGVVRLVRETGYVRLGRGEVLLHMAPLAFDASTLEIWGALLTGGCVVVMPPGTPSLAALAREVERRGVTTLWLTAGLFHLAVDEHPEVLAGLRQLLAGGDVLSAPHVRRALALLPPGARLINGYGPTESTTFACCHVLTDPAEVGAAVPLGRPIANTRVLLLDRALELVPAGVPGELCIGGDGLARGYLGRPDLTAERFVPHSQGAAAGERLYRTGDLARWFPDGRVEFLGRLDAQVKIRGFRIEPGEVEAALARHPSVREAVVAVYRAAAGERRLAAYLVLREPGDLAGVRSHAARTLPPHMVPADWTVLGRLPLTANGKVNRAALPAPEAPVPAGAPAAPVPASPVAEILAGIWAEVLHLDGGAPAGDFYALGGHSLLATQVVARVRATFGVDVPLRALLEEPALENFARRVEEEIGRGRRAAAAPPIVPVPRDGGSPLSLAQRRLWFLDRLEPGNPAYNIPAALRISGDLSPAVLAASLAEIVRRHETLRSSFPESGGVPVQRIAARSAVSVPVADLSALCPALREPLAAGLLAAENRRPFDLSRGPLLRALLLRLAPREHLAVLTVHHIVSDGWSMEILVRELGAIYAALAADRPSPLPELPFQYPDFAAWQQGWLEEEIRRHQLPYWRGRLAGAPAVLDLPIARPRRGGRFRSGLAIAVLPVGLGRDLRSLARRQRATFFMVLLAGWKALLALLSGQTDLLVGTPIANRHRREIEEMIGFFVNTLVLRTDLSGNPSFAELLARVRDVTLEAHAHQDLSFDRLVEELDPPRVPGRNPLFQVLFDMLSFRGAAADLPGLHVEILPLVEQDAKFDMTLYVAEGGESTVLRLAYDANRFEAAAMEHLLADYRVLLERAAGDPEAPVSALLRPQEHQEAGLVSAFNESLEDFQEV